MSDPQKDFWQVHSDVFLEMAFRTDRQEVMAHPDGVGQKSGDCGDTIAFYLKAGGHSIKTMSYAIHGCIHTNACANAIIEMVEGQSLEQAWEISPEAVSHYLKTLPPDHFHCAELAVGALYLALADLRNHQKSPWKKAYR